MKKSAVIAFLFLSLSGLSSASDLIYYPQKASDSEMKKALGKTIVKQKELKFNQDFIYSEVQTLKEEIKALKILISNEGLVQDKSHSTEKTRAETIYPFTNIREQPSDNSRVVKTVIKGTVFLIEKCEPNNIKKTWCKVLDQDVYIRDYTLNFIK